MRSLTKTHVHHRYGLALEAMLHTCYYPSLLFYTDLYDDLALWERFAYMMMLLSFVYVSTKVRWDCGRLLGLALGGVDMPEDAPGCPLATTHSFTSPVAVPRNT